MHFELKTAHVPVVARPVSKQNEVAHAFDKLAPPVRIERGVAGENRQVKSDLEALVALVNHELLAAIACKLHIVAHVVERLDSVEAFERALHFCCDFPLPHEPGSVSLKGA